MNIKKIGNKIIVTYILKKGEMYKFSKGKTFESISIYKKPQILKGIASYCECGKHVIFIDTDNVPRWLVLQDYLNIQKQFNLPQAFLFSTKEEEVHGEKQGSYHLICLAKFHPKEIYEILSKTHADVGFMSMPLRRVYRDWVLRISDKRKKDRPKFIQVVGKDVNRDVEVSKPHFDFLNKIYKLDEINYHNLDQNKKIFCQEYEAS